MNRFMAITPLLVLWAGTANAQSSVRNQGSGYLNLSVQTQSGNEFFNADGEVREGRNLQQTILSFYGEIGLVDRWLMLSMSSELLRRNVLTDQGATTGLGDLRLGLWSELVRMPRLRVLVGLQAGVPTGDERPQSDDADEVLSLIAATLPTGDGEFDLEGTVVLSGDIAAQGYPLRHYWIGQLGYWGRTQGFINGLTYRAEIGTQIAVPGLDRIWWVIRGTGVEALGQVEAGGNGAAVGIGNGVSYTVLGGEIQARVFKGFGLGAGVSVPLRGEGVLNAAAFRFMTSFEF